MLITMHPKDDVRLHWLRTVISTVPPSQRAAARILFLPGRACLEVPLYTDAGFATANLVGVERDPKIAAVIRKSCPDLPLHEETVAAFFEKSRHHNSHFAAMNLDYNGQLSSFAEDLYGALPQLASDESTCLSFTALCTRDQQTVVDTAIHLTALRSALGALPFQRLADALQREHMRYPIGGSASHATVARQTGRELSFIGALMVSLGKENDRTDDQSWQSDISAMFASLRTQITPLMLARLLRGRAFYIADAPWFAERFSARRVTRVPVSFARYTYLSSGVAHRIRVWQVRFENRPASSLKNILENTIELVLRTPLHVYDASGNLVGGRCRFCE